MSEGPETTPSLAAQFDAPGPRNPLIPIAADARAGKEPCGECRIQPGETCDICGAKGPAYDTRAIQHPPYAHPGDVA